MSDKIIRTVVYEINPDGNCGRCWKSLRDAAENPFCMPFQTVLQYEIKNYGEFLGNRTYMQCKACKDYLSEQKSKVYCDKDGGPNISGIEIKINHQRLEIDLSIDTYKVKIYINEETADELLQKHSDNIPLDTIIEMPENLKLHGFVGLCFRENHYYLEFKLIGANKCKEKI